MFVVATREVSSYRRDEGARLTEPGNASSDVRTTTAEVRVVIDDVRGAVCSRKARNTKEVVDRGMSNNMDQSSTTSWTFRGTSLSAFPITEVAIRVA